MEICLESNVLHSQTFKRITIVFEALCNFNMIFEVFTTVNMAVSLREDYVNNL